jgi:hypothetical protein
MGGCVGRRGSRLGRTRGPRRSQGLGLELGLGLGLGLGRHRGLGLGLPVAPLLLRLALVPLVQPPPPAPLLLQPALPLRALPQLVVLRLLPLARVWLALARRAALVQARLVLATTGAGAGAVTAAVLHGAGKPGREAHRQGGRRGRGERRAGS